MSRASNASSNKPHPFRLHISFSPRPNTHMPFHDSPKKNRFIGAIFSGVPKGQAADQNGILRSTAQRLWRKFVKTGSTHALPRSGQPRKLTTRDTCHIIQESKKHRRAPLRELGNSAGTEASASTVCQVLRDEGRHRRKA